MYCWAGGDLVTGRGRSSKLNSGPMLLVVTLPGARGASVGGRPPEVWALPLGRRVEEDGAEGGGEEEALALLGKSLVRQMLLWVWVQMLLVLVLWEEALGGVAGTSHDTSGEKPIWSGHTASRAEPGPLSLPPSPDLLAVGDVLGAGCGLIPVYCWGLCIQTGERGGEGPGEAAGTGSLTAASSSLESDRTISSGSWRPRGGSGEAG